MKSLKGIYLILNKSKSRLFFICSLILLTTLMQVLTARLIGPIIDASISGDASLIMINSVKYIIIVIIGLFFSIIKNIHTYKFATSCEEELYNRFIESIEGGSLGVIEKFGVSKLISITNNDIRKIKNYLMSDFIQLLYIPILTLGIFTVLAFMNITLTVILFVLTSSVNLWAYKMSKKLKDKANIALKQNDNLVKSEIEIIKNLYTVKISDVKDYFIDKNKQAIDQNIQKKEEQAKAKSLNYIPSLVNEYIPLVIVIMLGGYFVSRDLITVGEFVVYVQLMNFLCLPLSKYAGNIVNTQITLASIDRYLDVIKNHDECVLNSTNIEKTNKDVLIEFRNVSFSYDSNEEILSNISFKVRAGEKIGIVGKTGCGKSTILKLLLGLHKPTSGEILYKGIDINHIDTEAFLSSLSLVDQRKYMLPGSLTDNILPSSDSINEKTKQEAIEALKWAAWNFNDGDGKCIDEIEVGENGKNLSEGQKSKLSLARALYKKPELILFDEPTASLHPKDELLIVRNIIKETKISALIITHRMSTAKECDRLFRLIDDNTFIEEKM